MARRDNGGRNKSGGGRGCLFFVIGLIAIGYLVQRATSPGAGSPDADDIPAGGQPKAPSYALSATRDNWPPVDPAAGAHVGMDRVAASNYYVVLDGSGSMAEDRCAGNSTKIEVARKALATFTKSVPADANLGLLVFDGQGISERVPLGVDNREQFAQALRQARAEGGTPLRTSISMAYDQLGKQAQQQLGYGEYHLVVVTDGKPDPSSEDPSAQIGKILAESPVVVHTIGFCIGSNHVLNQPGRTYYVDAESPADLEHGLDSVLAEAPSFDVKSFDK